MFQVQTLHPQDNSLEWPKIRFNQAHRPVDGWPDFRCFPIALPPMPDRATAPPKPRHPPTSPKVKNPTTQQSRGYVHERNLSAQAPLAVVGTETYVWLSEADPTKKMNLSNARKKPCKNKLHQS